MDGTMSGRVAVVTGASRGIGLAAARALGARGAKVITMSSSHHSVPRSDRDLGIVEHLAVDVADWEAMRPAFERIAGEHGPVDFLSNNAGVRGQRGPVWELDSEEWVRTLAVNTLGAVHGMKAVLPAMIRRRAGVIVNTSSGAGHRPRPNRSMYGASKAALDHISLAVAQEVAEFGIRVHVFHAGPVDTALYRATSADPGAGPEELDRMKARYRAGEVQRPEGPGGAIAWLATDDGARIGDVIVPWRDAARRKAIAEMAGLELPPGPLEPGS